MVQAGTRFGHKCVGAQARQISHNVLPIKGEGCNIGSRLHGQEESPVILNEYRGCQKPRVHCDQ